VMKGRGTTTLIGDGSTGPDDRPPTTLPTLIGHQIAMVSRHVREGAERIRHPVEPIDALRTMSIDTDGSEKILAILRTTGELRSRHLATLRRERQLAGRRCPTSAALAQAPVRPA
jgi:hypothetical protein